MESQSAQRAVDIPEHQHPLSLTHPHPLFPRAWSDAHHLVTAPMEGISLPEPAAIAANEAHTAVAVSEVGPPHQGAVPENPQRLGVNVDPGKLRGRQGGRVVLCGLLLHGAGHRDGPERPPGQVSGVGTEGPTDAHTWPGTAWSLQLRGPFQGPL